MAALLNRIIAIGGTTAHQSPFPDDKVLHHYISADDAICCLVAEDDRLIGFQSLGRHAGLPRGWADIGTFVDPDRQRTGAGAALFAATRDAARKAGVLTINATIRADNAPGLGFYARSGFRDYATDPDFALTSGEVVGRVSRRFDI